MKTKYVLLVICHISIVRVIHRISNYSNHSLM